MKQYETVYRASVIVKKTIVIIITSPCKCRKTQGIGLIEGDC